MDILMNILYILLFLFFLSVLIMIHELGHLIAAKTFKVYCLEYSIGMGPLLFKFKRKNGETQFSLRGIPFGGYVSMYGEGVELPEGVVVDESRSLNGIKPWKRAIVLLAGVTMNALLALSFFFVTNLIPREETIVSDYINQVTVAETSELASVLDSGAYFKVEKFEYEDTSNNTKRNFYLLDNQTFFDGDDSVKYATCFYFEGAATSIADLDFANYIYFYGLKEEIINEETVMVPDFEQYIKPSTFTEATVHITERIPSEIEGQPSTDGETFTFHVKQIGGVVQSFGLFMYYQTKNIHYNFGEAIGQTFVDFGKGSVAIFGALGELFTNPKSWGDVSGVIGMGFITTKILKENGFVYFLRIWGIISVNLAIFNLIPFPGLDGWQLLVLGVETTTRKKIPEKVKNIVSLVGILLLLGLMLVIVFKDVFTFII